jgi:hypothetical protein
VKKLFALVFGCGLALLICELALRVTGYAGDHERERSVFDPRYGTVPRDSWIWSFDIDPAKHHAVDLRGQLIALEKPMGETRVLFVGDSATEGALVGLENSFPNQFAARLKAAGAARAMRVINAGVWGMTTVDEYHLLKDKLLPLKPDVVVIGLFMSNDINFNLGHRERQLRASTTFEVLRSHSALVHFVSLRLLALGAKSKRAAADWVPLPAVLKDQRGLHMLSYPEGELATYVVPQSVEIDHAYEVLKQVFSDFIQLGREHNFKLKVLLVPSPSRVLSKLAILHYPNLLSELRRQGVAIDPSTIDVDEPTRRVLEVCASLDLTCMDPTQRLQHLGAKAFFPTDEHPTIEGHRELASELLAN